MCKVAKLGFESGNLINKNPSHKIKQVEVISAVAQFFTKWLYNIGMQL